MIWCPYLCPHGEKVVENVVIILHVFAGSESASYLYSSKPSSKVMRVAKVFGPWLLVGGGPSKKANLAGGTMMTNHAV